MKKTAPEQPPTPPLPSGPGAYLLTNNEWMLESVTQPPKFDGPQQIPVFDGSVGDDLRDISSPDGGERDPGQGPEVDSP